MIAATDQASTSTVTQNVSVASQPETSPHDETSAANSIGSSLQSALEGTSKKARGKASSTGRFSPASIEKIIKAITKLIEAFAALAQAYNRQPSKEAVTIAPDSPRAPAETPYTAEESTLLAPVEMPATPEPSAEPVPDTPSSELVASSPGTPITPVDLGKPLERTAGFLWKPKSDKDGNLAILLPEHLTGKVKSVAILSPDGSRTLQSGRYAGNGNGGREHFRFSKPGGDFPDGSIVLIKLEDGSRRFMKIGNTNARVQK